MRISRYKIQAILLYLAAQPPWFRYGLAALAVAAATFATLYITVIGERAAFLVFFFAIIQTAFWLGRRPGIFAMALSLIAVNALILFPAWSSQLYDVFILNAGFCILSAVIVVTTSRYKQLTELLWKSRQDLAHAQAIGQIGSWRLNVQRNELHWSDENHRIFGIPKGMPMTYEGFLVTVHPDDHDYVDRMWQAALHGDPYDIEHRLIVEDKVKWVREKAELEFDKNGLLLGGFGTTQDITERKRSEQALKESQERYAKIIESAMDAIITTDVNQCILVFNHAAEKMFGCMADEVIGGSLERFIPERFRHAHCNHTRAFVRSGITNRKMGFLGTTTGLRTSGEEFPIEVSISQNGSGDEKSFTAVLRDITERERGEFELLEKLRLQDQLAKVAASVPGVICSFRLRPDGSASMPYASPAIESLFGLSRDVLAEDFSSAFARTHPDDLGHINDTIAESAHTLQPWRDAFRFNHPSKGEIWIEGHSMPLRELDGSILWHGYIQDVTARKNAEKELQERISRYELVLDGAQDAIWDWDVANKQVHFSSRWKILRGFEEHEVGDHEEEWSVGIHPDDKVHVFAALQAHFEGRTPVFNEEYRIRCKDGSWKWVLDRGIAQKDLTGQVIRMAGSESDITERKRATEALRASEVFVREVLNSLPEHVVVLDEHGVVTAVNEPWERFAIDHGGSAGGLSVGANYLEVCRRSSAAGDPDARKAVQGLEVLFAGQQQEFVMEYPCSTANEELWFIMHAKRLVDSLQGVIITHIDITEHKRAELALRHTQARLALIVEEVKAGYWDWDLLSQTLYLSPEWKRQIGFDENELSNQRDAWEDRLHPDDQVLVLAATEDYIAGIQSCYELEFRLLHKDGSYRWIHSRGELLRDQNNQPYRLLGINLDITDYKKTQELSEKRDQMEQTFRYDVARQTAAAIAHEMNQPLTAISSYADVALQLMQSGKQNPEILSHAMESCSQQAQRAGQVIRQLMTVLQKDEFINEPIDINTLIHEALDFVRADEYSSTFKIELDLAASLPPVSANSLQIQKVLINLLHNGLQSMLENRINAKMMAITTRSFPDNPAMAMVTVCDSGKGVKNAAAIKRIFQPFYTTKANGLGMGLAICSALIEAHGGKMWAAEQNADIGLSVHFTLPFTS